MAVTDRTLFERAMAFDLFPSQDNEHFEDEWCYLVRKRGFPSTRSG